MSQLITVRVFLYTHPSGKMGVGDCLNHAVHATNISGDEINRILESPEQIGKYERVDFVTNMPMAESLVSEFINKT